MGDTSVDVGIVSSSSSFIVRYFVPSQFFFPLLFLNCQFYFVNCHCCYCYFLYCLVLVSVLALYFLSCIVISILVVVVDNDNNYNNYSESDNHQNIIGINIITRIFYGCI